MSHWLRCVPAGIWRALTVHARTAYPRECAGIVVTAPDGGWHVHPETAQHSETRFEVSAATILAAGRLGDIKVMYHSHPNGSPHPSRQDKTYMLADGIPLWPGVAHVIIGLNGSGHVDIRAHLWNEDSAEFDSVHLEIMSDPTNAQP